VSHRPRRLVILLGLLAMIWLSHWSVERQYLHEGDNADASRSDAETRDTTATLELRQPRQSPPSPSDNPSRASIQVSSALSASVLPSPFRARPLTPLSRTEASAANLSVSTLPCPTVYVYLDAAPGDARTVVSTNITSAMAFGVETQHAGVYDSDPFTLAQLMLYRALHSGHCRWTRDPATADLFIIPSLSGPKTAEEWIDLCENKRLWGASLVEPAEGSGSAGYSLRFLPYLNADTARRHLFFISKGHYAASRGAVACAWIQGDPPAAPYFADVQRFAYSHTFTGYKFGKRKWERPGIPQTDGRVVSVPYPASLHWSARHFGGSGSGGRVPPWQNFTGRSTLIHFVAGMHGKQVALRKALFEACRELGEPRCRALATFEPSVLLEKARAVFCLEPEGDSPFRKSVYDSIAMGCIPVLFSHNSDAVSPWHWGPFRADSRVLLSEETFMEAKRSRRNGLQPLLDMPQSRIAAMQATIAAKAQRLQFAVDDMPAGDDAFELLLKKALLRAHGHRQEELAVAW
jgi:hypothetical protein